VSNVIYKAAEEVLRQNDRFFSLTHFYLRVADHARRRYGWVGSHRAKRLLGYDLVAAELKKRPDLLKQVEAKLYRRPSLETRRAVVKRLRGMLAAGSLSPELPKLPRDYVLPVCLGEGVEPEVAHSIWREIRETDLREGEGALLLRVRAAARAIDSLRLEVRELEGEVSRLCAENGRLREENSRLREELGALREKVAAAERAAAAVGEFLECFGRPGGERGRRVLSQSKPERVKEQG